MGSGHMPLPEELQGIRGADLYEALPPIRKHQAMRMMVGAALLTNRIHIERAEQLLRKSDACLARTVAETVTEAVI